ncbi:tetratricopeptide repeat protein [uncultured Bradyrhizobium sp.]|jgi:tetratricopeptide (TPR) repeat protein|uniref:tetratricopeptide repeat protein n=1 Tax=uncultured Bradyrhizobium sp. TaxID=199684 RepID=UPI002614641F|nr:tetratricopeptide repeat protein [uncultured Bradyrhizobium sp.]
MASLYAASHLPHIAGLERRHGPISDEVVTALRTLIKLILRSENPAEAIPFLDRCISIQESLHGPQSIMGDLDDWIGRAGHVDFKLVEPFQLRRLAIKSKLFGENSPEAAGECEAIARRWASHGDYSRARAFLERNISILEKLHGAASIEVATSVDALAEIGARLTKWAEAEASLQRSLHLKETIFGKRSEQAGRTLLTSAIVHANSSKLKRHGARFERLRKAETAFASGLDIIEERFGPDSLEVQKALEAMILAYLDCGEFWSAEPLLKRLLEICERTYGDDAAALLWILAELAAGYACERVDEAEPVLERGFAVLRTFLDVGKPIFHRSIVNMAGNRNVLYGGRQKGVLETLVQASETLRGNLRKRWGA